MPREHEAVVLLGEVAAYLAAWEPALKAVAVRFAAAAERWGNEVEALAAEALPDDAKPLRAKQCLLRQTALLCTCAPGSALDAQDARRALRLAVQVHHGAAYGRGTSLEKRLQELQVCAESSSRVCGVPTHPCTHC